MTATVKVKFRPSMISNCPGTLVYCITHRRIVRQIITDYEVYPYEWDDKRSTILFSGNQNINKDRKDVLMQVDQHVRMDIGRLEMLIKKLSVNSGTYTSDDIVAQYYEYVKTHSFRLFMEYIIAEFKQFGKERTSETYASALASFMRFRRGKDLLFEEITADLMIEYEVWLKANGLRMNTVSFYNRILRAVYNRAVDQGLSLQCYPFKRVYTGIDKTIKRAIQLNDIRRIKDLDLTINPSLGFARDMFLFSFYMRGMSFVDMAYLKKTDLKNGILTYVRRKTKQTLFIKWEKCMQELIDKYPLNNTEYMLPIIESHENERHQYLNALRLVNNRLKMIAALLGLHRNLTMYVSRHSWASIAKDQNIPISVISEGMGHNSEHTTRIYLASLDTSRIDKANKLILEKL